MVEDADRIRRQVGEAAGVRRPTSWCPYSHTHSGPLLHQMNVRAGMELVAPYWETLFSQTVGAARQAHLACVRR